MHLKMNTGLSGPCYCLGPGEEIPFDETFPFAARELRRHIDANGTLALPRQIGGVA